MKILGSPKVALHTKPMSALEECAFTKCGYGYICMQTNRPDLNAQLTFSVHLCEHSAFGYIGKCSRNCICELRVVSEKAV